MKILHIEAGRHLYGGAKQVAYLIRGLAELNHENVLICPADNPLIDEVEHAATVEVTPMAGDLDVLSLLRIVSIIRRHTPDLVHVHSRRGADIWGGLAASVCRIPVVCSRRVDNTEPPWWCKRKYAMYDKVISISQAIKDVLVHQGVPAEHITCVLSAVDTQEYRPAVERSWFEKEFAVEKGQRVIACFAQMIERKGQRTLINATKQLLETASDFKVLIFGQGPKLESYKQLVDELTLNQVVAFPGFRHDVKRILPNIDIVAHPANKEGLGVILLQSSACGVPAVAGDAGGIPEVVEDSKTGYLFSPGNVDDLTRALQNLLADDQRRREMGRRARHRAHEVFSVESMVKGNEMVYRQVLAHTRCES